MDLLHIFAANVKNYRSEAGLSQEKLAELAGLHRTYISAVEREKRNISITNGDIAPTIHLFVKPVYRMLNLASDGLRGQPLESVKNICIPNGLLLSKNPGYLEKYPGLFFPGKDDKSKAPRKIRVRVSFALLSEIAQWRVENFTRGNLL